VSRPDGGLEKIIILYYNETVAKYVWDGIFSNFEEIFGKIYLNLKK